MSVYGAFMESNPLLVSAGDLDSWADTEDAKGAFPELMRRLLAQTPGVSNINIRAHEGTAAPGWDGTATSAGSAYLPAGELRFEFGTNQDPKRKANEDYKKRAKEAAGTTDEIIYSPHPGTGQRLPRGRRNVVTKRYSRPSKHLMRTGLRDGFSRFPLSTTGSASDSESPHQVLKL